MCWYGGDSVECKVDALRWTQSIIVTTAYPKKKQEKRYEFAICD